MFEKKLAMSYFIYLIDGFLFYAYCVVVVLRVFGLILFSQLFISMFGKMSYVTNYGTLKVWLTWFCPHNSFELRVNSSWLSNCWTLVQFVNYVSRSRYYNNYCCGGSGGHVTMVAEVVALVVLITAHWWSGAYTP